MDFLRRRLTSTAALAVAWQLATAALTPVALCCLPPAAGSSEAEDCCAAEGHAGAMCPMAAAREDVSADSRAAGDCGMICAVREPETLLLVNVAAPLPSPPDVPLPAGAEALDLRPADLPNDALLIPPSPPPRA